MAKRQKTYLKGEYKNRPMPKALQFLDGINFYAIIEHYQDGKPFVIFSPASIKKIINKYKDLDGEIQEFKSVNLELSAENASLREENINLKQHNINLERNNKKLMENIESDKRPEKFEPSPTSGTQVFNNSRERFRPATVGSIRR